MDNISEFILHTTEEAKRRGLEISIASVSLAKPVETPAAKGDPTAVRKATATTAKAIEDYSWITVPEAARMLRCSTSLIYHRIHMGQIPGKRNKYGNWIVPSSIVDGFEKSHNRQPIPVRCVQTNVIYPSLTAAAKAIRTDLATLTEAMAAHKLCKNLTFEKVDS